MERYIKISELSKLMNVSVHQIRYFEDKGVLKPSFIDDNQYRMYGVNEIYRLSQILLLRKLNLSVKQIEASMDTYNAPDYEQLLNRSLEDIEAQMEQLAVMKRLIQKTLHDHAQLQAEIDKGYQVKELPSRGLQQWAEFGEEEPIHAGHLYAKQLPLPNLFEADLHYIYWNNRIALCFESDDPAQADYVLEGGRYMCRTCFVEEERDMVAEMERLQRFLQDNGYSLSGKTIWIEKSYLSLFNNQSLVYEIQIKIS